MAPWHTLLKYNRRRASGEKCQQNPEYNLEGSYSFVAHPDRSVAKYAMPYAMPKRADDGGGFGGNAL